MGFYNIFRMLRLILKDIFGYKTFRKILIILLTIFILCFFYTKVFGVFSDEMTPITILNTKYNIDIDYIVSQYDYFAITYDTPSTVTTLTLTLSNSPFYYSSPGYLFQTDNSSTAISVKTYVDFNTTNKSFTRNVNLFNTNQIDPTKPNNYYYYQSSGSSYYMYMQQQTATSGVGFSSKGGIVLTNQDIYDKQGNLYYSKNYTTENPPTLGNSQSDLENLNFSNFIINANDYTEEIENNDGTLYMLFYNKSLDKTTVDYLYPIKEKGFTKGSIYTDYENSTSTNMVFSYPIFMSGVFFNVGSTYQIRFAKQNYNTEYGIMTYEYLGEPYTFTVSSNVTQDYINQLNQQTATSSDSESTQELQSSINQQTQSINDINNSINDSNVDNSSINLPTDNTNDPTQNGVDNIFQTIYNSFTSGTAQDIVFPIPNTDKNITLQANYTYNMLQNSNASWIINIIQAFYWYIISRYIIVDIMQKVRKIKQGDLEDIQNSNIKEDML